MPKISVIVPVYNVEAYLEKCVRSVLAQTCPHWELLLVDDGSTDHSGAMCNALAQTDPRIRVIHQKNQGLGGARNTGIGAAAGEWLAFLDSDDWLEPKALEQALSTAEKTGADLVVQAFRTVDESGRQLAVFTENLPKEQPLTLDRCRELLFIAPCAWAKLYKAKLFQELRYPPRVWYEDLRTTLKLLPTGTVAAVSDDVAVNYLQRQGSIMSNMNLSRNREILEAMDDLIGWYRARGFFDAYRDELAYLAVYHVLVTACVRVLRADQRHPLLKEFSRYVKDSFPDYKHNPYLPLLGKKRRLVLALLEMGLPGVAGRLFRLKEKGGRK